MYAIIDSMKSVFNLGDYVEEIEINGLRGRMINAPARKAKAAKLNILFIHGHHSSLERMAGAADLLMDYANFCLPDLPGFGGMDNFYSLGMKPTLDNYADYLASFIKLHYKASDKIVLIGYSMGFLVVTKMLQKYPDLRKRIVETVAVAGFLRGDDFIFTERRKLLYRISSKLVETRLLSFIFRELFLRKWLLSLVYTRTKNAKHKFKNLSRSERKKMVNMETTLWRINHIPTWCYTTRRMFDADLTAAKQLPIELLSVVVSGDQYFKNDVVEQHFKIAFSKVKTFVVDVDKHGMSVASTGKEVEIFFPKLRQHLKALV